MAIHSQQISSIQRAKARRLDLTRYLHIDGSRYLLGVVVLLCLMSLIALAQTGVVATKGYAIAQLDQQRTDLLRERSQLQLRQAAAHSLSRVRGRAEQIGMRQMGAEQARYITVPAAETADAAAPTINETNREPGGELNSNEDNP